MLLRAYCDLSKSNRVSLVGGYVGTAEQWDDLDIEWRKNLDYWELSNFHLAELAGMMGHTRANDCVLTFSRLVRDSGLYGISAGVENAYYEAKTWPAIHPSAYHVCVDMLFDTLNREVPINMDGDSVALVLDRDTHNEAAVHALLARYAAAEKGFISGIAFSDRKTTPALQVADLAAGVVRKGWVEDDYFSGPPNAKKTANAMGVKHFGMSLSFESERIVKESIAASQEAVRD